MEMEDSIDGNRLGFTEIKIAGSMCGPKADVWKLIALRNIFLHFLIPPFLAAVTTRGIDSNHSIRHSRYRIEMNYSAFESKVAPAESRTACNVN